MPHDRYYIDLPLVEGEEILLEGAEAHHLFVMRNEVGEKITLINGKNLLAEAKLVEMNKTESRLLISKIKTTPPPTPLILAQALPRINRLDSIVEKGTELGATEFWFFPGELSEKKELKENDLKRLERITIASIKQCGRLDLPPLCLKPPLRDWEQNKLPLTLFFGDTDPRAPPLLSSLSKEQPLLFLVGPESGFTSKEVSHLKKLGAQGVKLHRNILRTDSAGMVALSIIGAI